MNGIPTSATIYISQVSSSQYLSLVSVAWSDQEYISTHPWMGYQAITGLLPTSNLPLLNYTPGSGERCISPKITMQRPWPGQTSTPWSRVKNTHQHASQDFKWREWSNGAKSQDPKKSLGLPAKPQKIPGPKINPPKKSHLKVPERGNAITQRKTLQIEHLCSVEVLYTAEQHGTTQAIV